MSLIWFIARRTCFNPGLASSLISSSSITQRRISFTRMVTGLSCSNSRPDNLHSHRIVMSALNALARPAVSNNLQMRRSSPLPSTPPISSRRMGIVDRIAAAKRRASLLHDPCKSGRSLILRVPDGRNVCHRFQSSAQFFSTERRGMFY